MKDKVVVFSIDAMITKDLETLRSFPETAPLFEKCALVEEMVSVYPALTYPCHVSIATGCYPEKHGIFHNEKLDINNPHPDWYWFSSYSKVPFIWDYAKKAGLVTASVFWPVSTGSDIDYRIAKFTDSVVDDEKTRKTQEIYNRYSDLLIERKLPDNDIFANLAACDMIREIKPDLLFVYCASIDAKRHKFGVDTQLHVDTLKMVAEHMNALVQASKDAGTYEDTTFIFLGDHGQIDIKNVFNPNILLAQKGYIDIAEDGSIKDWRIYCHSAACSCQVYTKDIDEKEAKRVLMEISEEVPGCIERIMTAFEAKEMYHLEVPCSFVLEGVTGISFGRDTQGDVLQDTNDSDYKFGKATHGHAPEKGAKSPFLVSGARAKKGKIIKEARIIDEAPTILSIFGIDMPTSDGHVLDLID